MAFKDNIEAVKKELNTEEQFLEGFIKAEGFFKKYKKLLIVGLVLFVLAVLGYQYLKYTKEQSLNNSNKAFNALQADPTNKEALETLKSSNPKLYEFFIFSDAVKNGKVDSVKSQISDPILSDLISYQIASQSRDGLSSYSMKQDGLLKNFSKLQEAYKFMSSGEQDKAAEILSQIPENSSAGQIAKALKHYSK